jgi:hypothetical protein
MKRVLISCAIALPILALTAGPALAEVKTREKTHVSLGGMMGKMFNLFGGKAAKEGVVGTTAVKGNRKATINESTGQIIDLSEEKIYDLDMKKKTYEVTTFEELRRRMREARERAEKDAAKEQGKEEKQAEKEKEPEKQYEVDFDVKETGQKKQLAGYDTHEVIMTITVREKGKTLEDGGGVVMTADSWLGPKIAALNELADFDMRYWKQLQGPEAMGMSAEQLATVIAMFPGVKQGMERMQKEGPKLQGTPLAVTTKVEGVKSKEQTASQQQEDTPKTPGGLAGRFMRKVAKKDDNESAAGNRAMIFTSEHEVQEVQTSVSAADLAIPEGFKEKK